MKQENKFAPVYNKDISNLSSSMCGGREVRILSKIRITMRLLTQIKCMTSLPMVNLLWEMPTFDMSSCKQMATREFFFLKDVNSSTGNDLKLKLYKHWLESQKESHGVDFHSSKKRLLFYMCNNYRDMVYYNKKPFHLKDIQNEGPYDQERCQSGQSLKGHMENFCLLRKVSLVGKSCWTYSKL